MLLLLYNFILFIYIIVEGVEPVSVQFSIGVLLKNVLPSLVSDVPRVPPVVVVAAVMIWINTFTDSQYRLKIGYLPHHVPDPV